MPLPPPEELRAGQTAYEQARAFERICHRFLPLYFLGFIPGLIFFGLFWSHCPGWAWAVWGLTLLLWTLGCRTHVRRLNRGYQDNLLLLGKLREQYGSALPWVEVENQLTLLAEIQREREQQSARAALPRSL